VVLGPAKPRSPSPPRDWRWEQLLEQVLFLHWAVPPQHVQRWLPPALTVDTCDGTAWISAVALHLWVPAARPALPARTVPPDAAQSPHLRSSGRPGRGVVLATLRQSSRGRGRRPLPVTPPLYLRRYYLPPPDAARCSPPAPRPDDPGGQLPGPSRGECGRRPPGLLASGTLLPVHRKRRITDRRNNTYSLAPVSGDGPAGAEPPGSSLGLAPESLSGPGSLVARTASLVRSFPHASC
jgi:hypothetical protein